MGRSGEHVGVEFTKEQFSKLVEKFPQYKGYHEDFRYRNEVNLKIRDFSHEALLEISNIFKESEDRGQAAVVTGYCNIIANGSEISVGNLKRAEVAVVNWIRKNCIRGWIFDAKTGLPKLVTDVQYNPPVDDDPAYTLIHTRYSEEGDDSSSTYRITNGDCKQSVTEIMFGFGFVHETPELHRNIGKP